VGPKELEQPLEPVRSQQARRAAAKIQRVEAAHVVRRALAFPLGGDASDEVVQSSRVGSVADRRRGEVAVVALRPAERHMDVDVVQGAGESVHVSPPPTITS
jgi:hypothetical protein